MEEAVRNNEYSDVYKKFIRWRVKKFLACLFFLLYQKRRYFLENTPGKFQRCTSIFIASWIYTSLFIKNPREKTWNRQSDNPQTPSWTGPTDANSGSWMQRWFENMPMEPWRRTKVLFCSRTPWQAIAPQWWSQPVDRYHHQHHYQLVTPPRKWKYTFEILCSSTTPRCML